MEAKPIPNDTLSDDEILVLLRGMLLELFEIEPSDVLLETNLREDLDLDSIDAIDMVARVQKKTGHRIEIESLLEIKTVADVVAVVRSQIGSSR